MKKEVREWLNYADSDVEVALEIIDNPHLTQMVAFHCQQAVEKYLKAYLLEKEKSLIKTHDLIKLHGLIKEIKDLGIDEKNWA